MNMETGISEPGIGKSSWECDRQSGTSICCSLNTPLSPIIIPPVLGICIHSSAINTIVLDRGAQIPGVNLLGLEFGI
jgi:hypothetical protein